MHKYVRQNVLLSIEKTNWRNTNEQQCSTFETWHRQLQILPQKNPVPGYSLLRLGLKQRLRDYPEYEVEAHDNFMKAISRKRTVNPANEKPVSAMRMTSSSRDIYFHTPSRHQTKL